MHSRSNKLIVLSVVGLGLALLIPSSPRSRAICRGGVRHWVKESIARTADFLNGQERDISSGGMMPERIRGVGPEQTDRREDVKHNEVWFAPLPQKVFSRRVSTVKLPSRRVPVGVSNPILKGSVRGVVVSRSLASQKYVAPSHAQYWSALPVSFLWKAIATPEAFAVNLSPEALEQILGTGASHPGDSLGLRSDGIGSRQGPDFRQSFKDAIDRGIIDKSDAIKLAERIQKRQQDLIGQGVPETQAALIAAQEAGIADKNGNPQPITGPNGGNGGGGGGGGGGGSGGGGAGAALFGAAAIIAASSPIGIVAAGANAATSIAKTNANAAVTMAAIASDAAIHNGAAHAFVAIGNAMTALFINRDQQNGATNRMFAQLGAQMSILNKEMRLKYMKFYGDIRNNNYKMLISSMQTGAQIALSARMTAFQMGAQMFRGGTGLTVTRTDGNSVARLGQWINPGTFYPNSATTRRNNGQATTGNAFRGNAVVQGTFPRAPASLSEPTRMVGTPVRGVASQTQLAIHAFAQSTGDAAIPGSDPKKGHTAYGTY